MHGSGDLRADMSEWVMDRRPVILVVGPTEMVEDVTRDLGGMP